jgi:hypothetical protein
MKSETTEPTPQEWLEMAKKRQQRKSLTALYFLDEIAAQRFKDNPQAMNNQGETE